MPSFSEVFPWLGCVPCTHPEIPLLFPRESLSKGLIVHCGISFHPRDMGGCGTGNFCCCSFNVTTQHVRNTLFVLTKITKIFFPSYYYNDFLSFTDVSVSYIPLVSESVPHKWFDSRHKKPYFPILFLWLLLGNVLSNAYRSNLLAVLVKVDFEKQPETFQDLLDQKLEMYIMSNTVATLLLKYSPFERHRRVFEECLLDRGGYYESPPQGTPEVLARMRVY